MDAVTPAAASFPAPDPEAAPARRYVLGDSTPGRVVGVLVALVAHAAVGLAWLVTALAVMGSLGVLRRIPMNSEFAWDTGRLPQPWVIGLGIIVIVMAHLLFGWVMRNLGRGRAAWGPSVVAWCGALLGVVLGAYFWIPPVQVGEQVGPAAGEATPWGPLGWIAHYARLALPAAVALVTGLLLLFSRNSPLVVAYRWWRDRRRARPRRTRRRSASEPAVV